MVQENYLLPEYIFYVSALIIEEAKYTLNCNLNSDLVISLADYINLSITRLKKYNVIKCYLQLNIF
ncbi:MAG: hypothetical protein HUJ77_02340 [Clostridium sp.]|nr:hypothetical protein [Clostridium sp.]